MNGKFSPVETPGTLILMDWFEYVDGRQYRGFYGDVSVYSDLEAVGFEAKVHNTANWVAVVKGPTVSITLMGCQIRGFIEGVEPPVITASQMLVLP